MEFDIGIFGDSFAENHIAACDLIYKQNLGKSPDKNQKIVNQIKEKIPAFWSYLKDYGFEPDASFGKGGSDMQYSFRNFLDCHHNYKRNIFIITHPSRISVNYRATESQSYFDWIHGTNPEACESTKKICRQNKDAIGEEIADGILDYQMKVAYHNNSRDYLFTSLMVEKILSIRPDTIMINAFDNWSPMVPSIKKTVTLFDICKIENEIMRLGTNKIFPTLGGRYDMRNAHLTPESARLVAREIYRCIKLNRTWVNFNLEEFKTLEIKKQDWFVNENELRPWLTNTLGINIE